MKEQAVAKESRRAAAEASKGMRRAGAGAVQWAWSPLREGIQSGLDAGGLGGSGGLGSGHADQFGLGDGNTALKVAVVARRALAA